MFINMKKRVCISKLNYSKEKKMDPLKLAGTQSKSNKAQEDKLGKGVGHSKKNEIYKKLAGHEGLPREIGKFLMKEKVLDNVSKNPDIALKAVVEQSELLKLKFKVVELLKGIKAAEEESKAAAEAGAVAEEPATVKTITKIIEAFTQKVETYDDIDKLMSVKDVLRFFKKNYQKLNGSADKKIESINQLTKILDDTTTNKEGLELLRELFEELG